MARHALVLLMTLCCASTFAHEPVNRDNHVARHVAKKKVGHHSPSDVPAMRTNRLGNSEPTDANANRFCMKNYLGKVHCIQMPNHAH